MNTLLGDNQPKLTGRGAALWDACDGLPLTPLERKAVYAAGLIRHLAETAGLLLREGYHLGAYLVAMGAVETLGGVARGGKRRAHEVAVDGLRLLIQAPVVSNETVIITTSSRSYSVRDCLNRRDFTAHGGRMMTSGTALDEELTIGLLCRLVDAIDNWWTDLKGRSETKAVLAAADLVPLETHGRLVFVEQLWEPLVGGASPGGELQNQEWRIRCG